MHNQFFDEERVLREHNKVYGGILKEERRKRKIAQKDLASGILSRIALKNVEDGKAEWRKAVGDTLMQRMGVSTDYFEAMASAEELDRWRLREDICLLVFTKPEEAAGKLTEYRRKYEKRDSIEEQFLLKAEALLLMTGEGGNIENESILALARQAADCTVSKGWEKGLGSLWLAPGELEAILLVGWALFLGGRKEEAQEIQQAVWNYPKEHQWKERMQVLILPQAAILGMKMNSAEAIKSFSMGKEALELLRRNHSHCYVLPLLECLTQLPAEGDGEKEYAEKAGKFREAFQEIYQWFDYPEYRLWQGISVDNTREAGLTLKMLRKFYRISRANAVYNETEQIISERQLEKIEKGTHKPSYENYGRLVKQYGKNGKWYMPMLETDSADILELRQVISTLIEFEDWQRAERKIETLKRKVNPEYPRVRQELMFMEGLLKWEKEGALEETLEILMEALHCTVPDFEGRDMKWWVFQQEEIMIASDIAALHRGLGHLEEAEKWFAAVIMSIEEQCKRTEIWHYGFGMLRENYDNLLGDIGCYDKAGRMNEETLKNMLGQSRINGMHRIWYRIAWNTYELANEKPEGYESLRQKWKKAFCLSEVIADFMYDSYGKQFLNERKTKYYS